MPKVQGEVSVVSGRQNQIKILMNSSNETYYGSLPLIKIHPEDYDDSLEFSEDDEEYNFQYKRRGSSRRDSLEDCPLLKSLGNISIVETANEVSRLPSRKKLCYFLLLHINICVGAAVSTIGPLFPGEASSKGVSNMDIGILCSLFALNDVILSPFVGLMLDKVGCKRVILYGLVISSLSYITFGFIDYIDDAETFFWACIVIRFVGSIGTASLGTASLSYIAQIFPNNLGSIIGSLQTSIGVGYTIGPILAGILYELSGFPLPYFFLGGKILTLIPLAMFAIPDDINDTPTSNITSKRSIDLMKLPPVILIFGVIIIISIANCYYVPSLAPHLKQLNLSAGMVGFIFSVRAIAYALVGPIVGYVSDQTLGSKPWIVIGFGLVGCSIALIFLGPSEFTGLSNTTWMNIISLFVLGISTACGIMPAYASMLKFALKEGHESTMALHGMIGGLFNCAYAIGQVTGPLEGSYITDNYGFPVCSSVTAGLCLGSAVIFSIYFQFIYNSGRYSLRDRNDRVEK